METKLQNFLDALEDNGEFFISSGNGKQDLAQIEAIIQQQGYWSGVSRRYYFDKDFNLLRTEERRFGR